MTAATPLIHREHAVVVANPLIDITIIHEGDIIVSPDRRVRYNYVGTVADTDGARALFAQTDKILRKKYLRLYWAAVDQGSNFSIRKICPCEGIEEGTIGFQDLYAMVERSEQRRI
ncbi:MAG: hypothetical protein KJ600_04355 [Nanoarchaeota archaeon]|nr:hypothetical protein [Nanoarchaeota archaeon]MBU1103760.1 hypothetical protein [Nanoarchaeota archaeon]